MNVAIANYEYPPNAGGGGEFSAALSDALTERGHHVALVVGGRDGQTSTTKSLLTWPFLTARELRDASKQSDVVNTHFTVPTSVLAPILSGNTPLVVNAMGADIYDPTRYQSIRPILDAANRWVSAGADRLIVPSNDMYQRLSSTVQEYTDIVPYFVDADRYRPPRGYTQPHDPLRLLTVGRIVKRKNLKKMFEAVSHLDSRGCNVQYTVAGDGPMREELQDYADADRFGDCIDFTGYVDESELPGLYAAHDIFALPSHHEAFGIVVLEALSSGLPVVTSDTGGHADIVTSDVGATASADSVGSLADAVLDVANCYPSKATAARNLVMQKYTAEAVIPQYERIYSEVQQ